MEMISSTDALSNVVASIALQEAGLAHIVNASREILGNVVKLMEPASMSSRPSASVADIIMVSTVVRGVAGTTYKMETELRDKLCCALSFLAAEDGMPDARTVTFRVVDGASSAPIKNASIAVMGRYALPNTSPTKYQLFTRMGDTNASGEATLLLPADQAISYIAVQVKAPSTHTPDPAEHSLVVPPGTGNVIFDGINTAIPTIRCPIKSPSKSSSSSRSVT